MTAPITYVPKFIADPDRAFEALRDDLHWEHRDAPRHEYYCNDFPNPYMYGVGKGRRLYEPRPYHPVILEIRRALEEFVATDPRIQLPGTRFEVCFLNMYMDQSDHLGWHADDSPEMDDARPIASISLGVEREIWFRPKPPALVEKGEDERSGEERRWRGRETVQRREELVLPERLTLGHGSLCLMSPGMQDTHQHRIPKSPRQCGERISLTFRGYVEEASR